MVVMATIKKSLNLCTLGYFRTFLYQALVLTNISFQVLQITKDKDQELMHNSSLSGNSVGNRSASNFAFVPMQSAKPVDTCDDNLCFNGGFCDPLTLKCRCRGHFIGNEKLSYQRK